MPVSRMYRLGWNQPLANTLTGPDAPNLRRIFQSLQNWIDFPLVGLQGTQASFAAGSANVAWATELYDDYMLHDANSANIRVPSQAQQYFALGAFTGEWSTDGAGRRIFVWRKNGVDTNWSNSNDVAGVSFLTAPFFGVVKRGDILNARVTHDAGSNLSISDMELWLVFLPLTS